MRATSRYLVSVFAVAALVAVGLVVAPAPATAADVFDDVANDNPFLADIEWLAGVGVTKGCNPPRNDRFCPDAAVTRGQMAAFLVRALGLKATSGIDFVDDNGSVFEGDIERMAAAGITRGCNPPTNDRFCPDAKVTRGQMAAFLVRALELPAGSGIDFVDDNGSVFEGDIERMAAAGITRGCNPPTNNRFCPDSAVTRSQMAAFLHRALGDRLHVKTYLSSLDPVAVYPGNSTGYVKDEAAEIDGRTYSQSLNFRTLPGKYLYAEYNLSRDYSTFCSTIGLSDLTETDARFEVEAYVDGRSKYVETFTLGESVGLRINVADGLRLKLEVRHIGPGFDRATFEWGDAHLQDTGECDIPSGSESPKPLPETYLTSLDGVDVEPGNSTGYIKYGNGETGGTVYTRSLLYTSIPGKDLYEEYNLSRDYNRFCSVVGVSDTSSSDARFEVEVFVDGVSKATRTLTFGELKILDVPVTNGLRLKVQARNTTPHTGGETLVFGGAYLATGSCK